MNADLPPIDDVLDGRVRLLVVGINPGRASAQRNRHFAGPGNRFWPALAASGVVPRPLGPDEQHLLPSYGVGITNLAMRPTARADQLDGEELRAGARRLRRLVTERAIPAVVVLGLTAYRVAFDDPSATRGAIPGRPGWWLADNPSGLNAHARVDGIAAILSAAGACAGLSDR